VLCKLAERVLLKDLKQFADNRNLIIPQQSGFRNNRSTHDNLVLLTQKISEGFNRHSKSLAIFFDISKAFDRVWHDGLLAKMIEAGFEYKHVAWVFSFLNNRSFRVRVGDSLSLSFPIQTGVPQG
jgi:hypothetical protein